MGRSRYRRDYSYSRYPEYVSVGTRSAAAEHKAAVLAKKGQKLRPVTIEGRMIARTFWGKAWCKNLEAYSDYVNRLPRGRSYVRHSAVIDLRIDSGKVLAQVMGSSLYQVEVTIAPLAASTWDELCKDCTGKIDSLIDLLQGKLSKRVMEVLTRPGTGMFPSPKEISLQCSCPDWATLCKHVAAVLYGVGARLDEAPELFFVLRQADQMDLLGEAAASTAVDAGDGPASDRRLDDSDLSDLFGIDIAEEPAGSEVVSAPADKSRAGTRGREPAPANFAAGVRVTAKELSALGIPHYTMQNWLAAGVLVHSGHRGVYVTTGRTKERLEAYLAKKSGSRCFRSERQLGT